jgi:hypothetical protein
MILVHIASQKKEDGTLLVLDKYYQQSVQNVQLGYVAKITLFPFTRSVTYVTPRKIQPSMGGLDQKGVWKEIKGHVRTKYLAINIMEVLIF